MGDRLSTWPFWLAVRLHTRLPTIAGNIISYQCLHWLHLHDCFIRTHGRCLENTLLLVTYGKSNISIISNILLAKKLKHCNMLVTTWGMPSNLITTVLVHVKRINQQSTVPFQPFWTDWFLPAISVFSSYAKQFCISNVSYPNCQLLSVTYSS